MLINMLDKHSAGDFANLILVLRGVCERWSGPAAHIQDNSVKPGQHTGGALAGVASYSAQAYNDADDRGEMSFAGSASAEGDSSLDKPGNDHLQQLQQSPEQY
jgi:hypothetical protein